jgi:hypothetical protein
MQYFDLYDWSDVYIDISTDLHNSVVCDNFTP